MFTAAPVADLRRIALDGGLGDWNPAAEVPVNATYSPPGSRFFATAADGAFVFALKTADVATAGARILIDSDRNDDTGSTVNGVYNESLVKFPPAAPTTRSPRASTSTSGSIPPATRSCTRATARCSDRSPTQ